MIRRGLLIGILALALSGCATHAPSPTETVAMKGFSWSGYLRARDLLLARYADGTLPLKKRMISRAEWEAALAPSSPPTAEELAELRRAQAQRIQTAKSKAEHDSRFDLDTIREKHRARQFCEAFPKGGMLHIHPSGTLKRETVRKLLEKNNPTIPFHTLAKELVKSGTRPFLYPRELRWLSKFKKDTAFKDLSTKDQARFVDFYFLPPGAHPFGRFDAVFKFIGLAVHDWQDEETLYFDFARRAAAEKVSYVEFTTGGINSETIPKYNELARKIATETGLTVRFNHAFARIRSPEVLAADAEDLLKIPPGSDLVGIDLLANETDTPALERGQVPYGMILSAVLRGKSGLHRTMHAGELGDPRNPRDAMILGAERLGHAVKLMEDPVALEYAAAHHIAVEINLTSNLRLEAVKTLKHHPFLSYLRLGIPASLSTDDEGIVGTDIDQECRVAIETSDITYSELKKMAFNSIESSFLSLPEKSALLALLTNQFRDFEAAISSEF